MVEKCCVSVLLLENYSKENPGPSETVSDYKRKANGTSCWYGIQTYYLMVTSGKRRILSVALWTPESTEVSVSKVLFFCQWKALWIQQSYAATCNSRSILLFQVLPFFSYVGESIILNAFSGYSSSVTYSWEVSAFLTISLTYSSSTM